MHRYRKGAREGAKLCLVHAVMHLGRARPLVSQQSYDYNEKQSAPPAQFGINCTIHARHTAWIIACLRYEVVDVYDPGHKCLVTLPSSLPQFKLQPWKPRGIDKVKR